MHNKRFNKGVFMAKEIESLPAEVLFDVEGHAVGVIWEPMFWREGFPKFRVKRFLDSRTDIFWEREAAVKFCHMVVR